MPLLDRLAGLETEYALRFHADPGVEPPSHRELFRGIIAALGRRVPTAAAGEIKDGVFLANGGAVWFEQARIAATHGLVEGATPECRGPFQTVLYQRAQDRLLAEAAGHLTFPGVCSLIKNDRDSLDNIYGAQENYEVVVARGAWLFVWRAGIVCLAPLAVLAWLLCLFLLPLHLLYLLGAGALYVVVRGSLSPERQRTLARALFGEDAARRRPDALLLPEWLEAFLLFYLRLVTLPLSGGLWLLARWVAFRGIRRLLPAFLASRAVIAGTGRVDRAHRFHLANKAGGINCLLGFGGLFGDRPMFSIGHFFKLMLYRIWKSPRELLGLLGERQRLQVCIGDSNMSEEAEYLRVGTTMLVLDALEAGVLVDAPRIRRPIRAMHQLTADPTLRVRLPLRPGGRRSHRRDVTALEIQHFYLDRCRRFVETRDEPNVEAREILDRWTEVLMALEDDPRSLVGRVDWVTKQLLLEEAGRGADWEALKKIDVRYHELTSEGYYARLKPTGLASVMIPPPELERAQRTPPPDTPATMRGHYIREFSAGSRPLQASWSTIVLGRGLGRKVVRLTRFQPRRPAVADDGSKLPP